MDDLNNSTALSGPEYTDIMVDIETTGTTPDNTAILQIGAVKFNLERATVCPQFFDKSLTIPAHRFWDQATANWWAQQKAGVLQGIMQRAEPWQEVLRQFGEFSYQNPGLRFWAKPTHFDFMFVASYFRDAGMQNPFHYRIARDMNSYIDGLFQGMPDAEVHKKHLDNMDFTGDVHNGLQDALHQLKVLFEARRIKSTHLEEINNLKYRMESLEK